MKSSVRPVRGSSESEAQRQLTALLRDHLSTSRISFTEHVEHGSVECWTKFAVNAPPGVALVFKLSVGGDQFTVTANHASVIVEIADFGAAEEKQWIDRSMQIVDVLLRSDLRIRVRRTWFWGQTGAIWVPEDARDSGNWNGDLLACRGKGTEFCFARPWYERVEDRSSP